MFSHRSVHIFDILNYFLKLSYLFSLCFYVSYCLDILVSRPVKLKAVQKGPQALAKRVRLRRAERRAPRIRPWSSATAPGGVHRMKYTFTKVLTTLLCRKKSIIEAENLHFCLHLIFRCAKFGTPCERARRCFRCRGLRADPRRTLRFAWHGARSLRPPLDGSTRYVG